MTLPVGEAAAAAGGTLLDAQAAPAAMRAGTDSRTLAPGDTFVALRGPNFDGHDYLSHALRAGAAMLVIDRPERRVEGVATIVVADTKAAYLAFAALARRRFAGRVLGITGSAGKTTTKAFAAQLLAVRFGARVLATPANENNEIGVSRLLLGASNADHDVVVVEMGARHFGDIAELVEIARPDVGVLTNVGDAHLEIFGSRERLAETKWALFARGARAVLNADDAISRARAPSLPESPHWFAARAAGPPPAVSGRLTALFGTQRLAGFENGALAYERRVEARVPGAHNRANLAAAAAAALEFGVELDALAAAIASLALPPGRFEAFAMPGGWRLIYDAYNASASGTVAALDALAAQRPQRAVAVLAGMAELGSESERLHEDVGAHAARCAGVVLVGGEHAAALARGALRGGMPPGAVVEVGSNAEAVRWLRANARPGDVVLLKGSRKYKLEEILEDLHA